MIYNNCNKKNKKNKRRKPLSGKVKDEFSRYTQHNDKVGGKKVIDEFFRYTQHNDKVGGKKVKDEFFIYTQHNDNVDGKGIFVPYNQFEDIQYFAEGGFGKIYRANWIRNNKKRDYKIVALKKLNDPKLNELLVLYECTLRNNLCPSKLVYKCFIINHYGLTKDPTTDDFMIIMDYYNSGDLKDYIIKNFTDSWHKKLAILCSISRGLDYLHNVETLHCDLHSGNILLDNNASSAIICDFGISKSPTTSKDDDDEIYGVIPYVAPEVFKGQKYTTASDIYSFGMIMWEVMTGRRPFWDRTHDTKLIIDIHDGLRPPIPPIVTNGDGAPKGYIDLMKVCWNSDPNNRPTASDILRELEEIIIPNELKNPTKITDIGPITANNPEAIYHSRPLSHIIKSAMSTRDLSTTLDDVIKELYESDVINDNYETTEMQFNLNTNNLMVVK